MPTFWLSMGVFVAAAYNLSRTPGAPWPVLALGLAIGFAAVLATAGSFGLLLGAWYRGRD